MDSSARIKPLLKLLLKKKTILSDDLEFYYGQTYAFNVSFLDENGNAYANGSVDISIDGTLINKATDANGTYSLEIYRDISKIPRLKPRNHTITSYNGRTNEYVTNRVLLKNLFAICLLPKRQMLHPSTLVTM